MEGLEYIEDSCEDTAEEADEITEKNLDDDNNNIYGCVKKSVDYNRICFNEDDQDHRPKSKSDIIISYKNKTDKKINALKLYSDSEDDNDEKKTKKVVNDDYYWDDTVSQKPSYYNHINESVHDLENKSK